MNGVFRLLGNRESHTTRAGETIAYGEVNPANEYVSIAGSAVFYDAAGNLQVDEDGRQYTYDEHNRLTQVKAADETVLANYTYDALGRRIAFEDPVAGTTVRYYYAGPSVIEEYDASPGRAEQRLRYLVNGAQYIDERIVSHDDATGQSTYYLANRNHSIAGTGNADGSVIERLDYSSGGDFGGGEPQPPDEYYFDADGDGDIDLTDYADFHACFGGPGIDAGADCDLHDWEGDYDIDGADFAGLAMCFSGDGGTPPPQCLLSEGLCHAFYFDADDDGDIDLADHAAFVSCLDGPDVARIDTCSTHDVDADYDVDLADHAAFAECYSGDGVTPPSACCQPTRYYHDADGDRDVDLSDWASLTRCVGTDAESSPFCVYTHDFDDTESADGKIDGSDHTGFWSCFAGPRQSPPRFCARDLNPTKGPREDDEPPPSGTFALHGRPIDVLSDGHVLIYIRNRYYDPKHSRWLQRDPTGYADGGNLYESFAGNTTANTDPTGTVIEELFNLYYFHEYLSCEEVKRALDMDLDFTEVRSSELRMLSDAGEALFALSVPQVAEQVGITVDPMVVAAEIRKEAAAKHARAVEATTQRFVGVAVVQMEAGLSLEEATSAPLLSNVFIGDVTGILPLLEAGADVSLSDPTPLSETEVDFLFFKGNERWRRGLQGGGQVALTFGLAGMRGRGPVQSTPRPSGATGSTVTRTSPTYLEYKALRLQGFRASEAHGLMKQFRAGANPGEKFAFHFTSLRGGQGVVNAGLIRSSRFGAGGSGVYVGTTPTPGFITKHVPYLGWGLGRAPVRIPIRVTPSIAERMITPRLPILKSRLIKAEPGLILEP